MTKLSKQQTESKIKFINKYINAKNNADASKVDANANVDSKNIATLEAELHKDFNIQINRNIIKRKMTELFSEELAEKYISQIENHDIYCHDESTLKPYCVAISMFPFLQHGLTKLGGESKAPKHLESYCGSFVNLIFAISSQFAGAVATVEFLMCFDYFARKDYGENYLETHKKTIENHLQHVVYALNQPASARNYQCVREDTTQLSTPEGYKYLSELKVGDECYVYVDGKIEIQKIERLNVYDFDGELMQFKGRNYQQTVTNNHRVLYKKCNTNEYDIKEAHELFGHSKLSLPIGCDGVEREDYGISDEILQLCVSVLTDGSISNSGSIRIYKSKNRYGYKEIPQWLNKLGIGYKEISSEGNDYGDMVYFSINSIDAKIITRQLKYGKVKVPHFFKLLSKRQIELVLNTWSKFDGQSDDKHTQLLQCDNEEIQNSLQELATLAGIGSELCFREMKKYNSDETCIVKYVKLFKRKDKRISQYNLVQYTGRVWCPTTKAGIVIFREENKIPYISGNSVFWNISIFDKYYYNGLFDKFVFPDGSKPKWETLNSLQKFFMKWFNKERTKAVLTFPVVTFAGLTDNKQLKDKDYEEFVSQELSEGNAFFLYLDDNVASLSSCCRLRNDISDQLNEFSYTLGGTGVMTGSMNVITMNLNKIIQDAVNNNRDIFECVREQTQLIHKYQLAFKAWFKELQDADLLPVYSANFITLKKQFLTVGINGLVESAEFLNLEISNNKEYKEYSEKILKTISDENKISAKKYGCKFNTEFVPAENLGVKHAIWDKKSGYKVNRTCYNSYMYKVEDDEISILDKIILHGRQFMKYLDGGSALHLNLENYPTKESFKKLLNVAVIEGCNYLCFNVKITICNDCNHIDKRTLMKCSKCGSKNIDYATRVIGYLKRVKSFSTPRQNEENLRHYHKKGVV